MQCSDSSVDTGNAQSLYLPAGIALEIFFELAGIEIVALTREFDTHSWTRFFHTMRIRWLGNVDQLKA